MREDPNTTSDIRRRNTDKTGVETKMAEIKRVGVLGCGLMGSGIAQISAAAGYDGRA